MSARNTNASSERNGTAWNARELGRGRLRGAASEVSEAHEPPCVVCGEARAQDLVCHLRTPSRAQLKACQRRLPHPEDRHQLPPLLLAQQRLGSGDQGPRRPLGAARPHARAALPGVIEIPVPSPTCNLPTGRAKTSMHHGGRKISDYSYTLTKQQERWSEQLHYDYYYNTVFAQVIGSCPSMRVCMLQIRGTIQERIRKKFL